MVGQRCSITPIEMEAANEGFTPLLDLFSTSQKTRRKETNQQSFFCAYNAPLFAYQIKLATYGVTQGCCNHWDCPRCGQIRAKQEYGRLVSGIRQLAEKSKIYFVTITCRGKEITPDEADENYLKWCNRLFSAWRARTKSQGGQWCYVAVTERQTRGHPHSHILTTADPGDLYLGHVFKERKPNTYIPFNAREIAIRSDWFARTVASSGLGSQYDISIASSPDGASRYVAKYLFKQTMFEAHWPKGWKRVRYSQNFPKLPDQTSDCMVLLTASDWQWLGRRAAVVKVKDDTILADVRYHLRNADTIIDKPSIN